MHSLPLSNSRTFLLLQKETPYQLAITAHPRLPSSWQPLIYFLSLWIWLFQTFHINGIIQCVYVVHVSVFHSLLLLNKYCIVWIYHILFTHSSVGAHLCYFYFLVIMNNASMTFSVWVVWIFVFSSLGLYSGVVNSYV